MRRRRLRRLSRAAATAVAAIPVACQPVAADRDVVVRDSAGVIVVENHAPAWAGDEGWVVAAAPSLTIGGAVDPADAPPGQGLGRVTGAVRLPGGGVVVADLMARALRFYDAAGAHRFDAGGEGEGPGEFRDLTSLQLIGDSLVVVDMVAGRVSVFDTTGAFLATRTLEFAAWPRGHLDDGSLVVEEMDATGALQREEVGPLDMTSAVLRYQPGRGPPDTLGVFPGLELYRHVVNIQGTDRLLSELVRFGREPMVVAAGDRVLFGDRLAGIHVLTPGAPTRLVRWGPGPRPATREDAERLVESSIADLDDPARKAAARNRLLDVPHGPTLLAYTDVQADPEGHVWVRTWVPPWEPEAQPRWEVFDSTGRWLGDVVMPPGLEVTRIGTDHVIGVVLDALDVPQVRVYRLHR